MPWSEFWTIIGTTAGVIALLTLIHVLQYRNPPPPKEPPSMAE
jgi:hypothetical protein